MEYVTNAVPSCLQFILRFRGGVHIPFRKFYLIVNTVCPHV